MQLKSFYFNLSIKYKIFIIFYSIIIIVSLVLGLYSYSISKNSVINKVSTANLGILRQINSSINFLQKDIEDISTYLCIDPSVQATLNKNYKSANMQSESELYIDNSLKFIMNLIASKSYISLVIIYGKDGFPPYHISTDGSSEINNLYTVEKSEIYKKAFSRGGSPLWFSMERGSQAFIQNNKYPKIGMCRIIRNLDSYEYAGFLVMCMNEQTIRNICASNIQTGNESILILDDKNNIVSRIGASFYSNGAQEQAAYIKESAKNKEGFLIDNASGRDLLITYSSLNGIGWKIFYGVPLKNITKEVNFIKIFTLAVILLCLFLSLPLMILVSSLLTAPLRKLLKSMKNFQEGNFDEKVEFKYHDEIGELGAGYNNMVTNIKELVHKAYILQLKEREAELNALQAQINPHFLYNTLDTIFWKAERSGEKEISEMVFSLSRMFRLSLNRGKDLTLVSREKELIEHYLLLQKIRLKNALTYKIMIDENILNFSVPKLMLQPFVENAILHGIGQKENGGTIVVKGILLGSKLHFIISDDGIGMSEERVKNLFTPNEDTTDTDSDIISGGYAIRNVNERLNLYFGNNYSLNFTSTLGAGTKVEIIIPTNKD